MSIGSGAILHITVNSQNLREYEGSNQTSGIHGTLDNIVKKRKRRSAIMSKRISEFPSEVIDEIKYYAYRLIDPRNGETFYVGKGKGNRVFNHMKCALALEEFDNVNDKLQVIHEIHTAGLEVIHVIHRHGMDEKSSMEVEAALIDAYPSATNIMGGTGSNDYGPMNALEIINKYAAEEAVFEHKVLMITINSLLKVVVCMTQQDMRGS